MPTSSDRATIIDQVEYDQILVDPDPKLAADGWRLRVTREDPGGTVLVERERVLPEKVSDIHAHNVLEARSFGWMHTDEIRWLRDRFNELLGEGG
jgi:hypothetical protein